MNKENVLFGIIGLLAGLIIGFMFANSVNQSAMRAPSTAMQPTTAGVPPANLPPGHPDVAGGNGSAGGGMTPEVQAAIEKARQNPNDYDTQLKAAETFYKIQRFDGAIEFLTQANKLQPDNYEVMVDLGNANFDTDKYDIDSDDAAALRQQAQYLLQYAQIRATIEGHCDERGTREYNIALGDRRANAAKNYLVSLGVPAARLTTVSYGKERPVALGSDEASWAQNRRAVTVVLQ